MSRALLLAECEPGTREFLERHLSSEGFEVLGAEAQRQALELAERVRPDLVLAGGLEDASGSDVCRCLREGAPGRSWDRNVPVIVLGEVRADAVDRVHAFERGCDDFVPRPSASIFDGGRGGTGSGTRSRIGRSSRRSLGTST
jgi:DNA-binding response OmpR family regulator